MEYPRTRISFQTDRAAPSIVVTCPPFVASPAALQPQRDSITILLVARDGELAEACRRELSNAGNAFVVSVSNCDRALELLGSHKLFDAVVIGIGAGDVDAVRLAQHMQHHGLGVPTVVVTSIPHFQLPRSSAYRTLPSSAVRSGGLHSLGWTIREAACRDTRGGISAG